MPRLTLACRDPGLGDLEANPRYHVDGLTGSPRPSNDSGSGEELDLGSTSESTDSDVEQGSESYTSLDQRLIICLVHRHLQHMAKSSVA